MSSIPKASAGGRNFLKGKTLRKSMMLQVLFYMQTGRRRVETLHDFLFAAPYCKWVEENYKRQITPKDFQTALHHLYDGKLIAPFAEQGEEVLCYDAELVFERFEEFEITRTGTSLIRKHLQSK